MVLNLFSRDIDDLIAKGKYGRAAKLLADEVARGNRDHRTRLRLADVLVMENRGVEAIPILLELSDEFAAEGWAAKAIALLKKVQRLSPGRRDAEQRLAALIKTGRQERPAYEGAGFAPSGATFTTGHFQKAAAEPTPGGDPSYIDRMRNSTWTPSTHQEEEATGEVALPPLSVPSADTGAPAADAAPAAAESEPEIVEEFELAPPPPRVVDTPLFGGFSQDELLEVIRGFKLRSFEPGDILILEGERGDSLFILTTGVVKAFVRNPQGGEPLMVRRMTDGDFFGEISILSGKPRTATVTAATSCELLELDRTTLDGITATYPHVRQVLEEYYVSRASTQEEEMRRSLEKKQ